VCFRFPSIHRLLVERVLYAGDLQFPKKCLVFSLVKGSLIHSLILVLTFQGLLLFLFNVIHVHAGTNNNVLSVAVVNVSFPVDALLQCAFLPGFTGSAHCTVQYGTDPTYMSLPYSAESTETGTAGNTVSVVLRERLNSSTVYYYTVSAVSGDVTVTVQGTFSTPQYSKCDQQRTQAVFLCRLKFTEDNILKKSRKFFPTIQ